MLTLKQIELPVKHGDKRFSAGKTYLVDKGCGRINTITCDQRSLEGHVGEIEFYGENKTGLGRIPVDELNNSAHEIYEVVDSEIKKRQLEDLQGSLRAHEKAVEETKVKIAVLEGTK